MSLIAEQSWQRKIISEPEDKSIEITKSKQQREKNEQSLREQCDNTKRSTVCVTGVPKVEEKECGIEKSIWRNSGRQLPIFGKKHKFKDSRSSSNSKQKKLKEIYAQIHHKLLKTEKEKVLKAAREKWCIIHNKTMIQMMQIYHQKPQRPQRSGITFLKCWETNWQPRILHPAKLSFKNKGEGFPGGAVVESLPANAGDTGSSPGLGRSHMPRSN